MILTIFYLIKLFWVCSAFVLGSLLLEDHGEQLILERSLNANATPALTLRLFTNNITPAEGDTFATYTEASGNGYASKTLSGGSWTVTTTSGTTEAAYAQQTFTFTGALGNVYGYFVVDSTTKLFWSERFSDGPYNITANGDAIKITPKIQAA
jgi:hypothetical protein